MTMRNIGWITLGARVLVAILALLLPASAAPYVFVGVMLLAALAYFRSNPADRGGRGPRNTAR